MSIARPKQWTIWVTDADGYVRGTWKLIRKGLSRNVTYKARI